MEEEVSIVIPTLNEEENIGELLDELEEKVPRAEVIVVDDGSTDNTREEAAGKASKMIERSEENDLSRSIIKGLDQASNQNVVVMDGDGQHPPEKVPEISGMLEENGIVVASREKVEGAWDLHRRLMSFTATKLSKFLFKDCRTVEDPVSGFFGVRKSAISLDRMNPRGYKVLVEILVLSETEIAETGYVFRQRDGGESSIGFSSVLDFLIHIVDLKYRQVK